MRSLRQLMECAGIDASGDVSVLFDYFGFSRGRVPTDPDTDQTASVSVLQQASMVDGDHVHLNVIRVGFDVMSQTDREEGLDKIDYAVYRTRNIIGVASLGVGRVQHFSLAADATQGRDDIGSESEADALYDEWSVDNDGIDAFVVRTITGDFVGISPIKGACSKGSGDDGLLAGDISRNPEPFARTFAHELGHYLGLKHNHGSNCPSSNAGQRNLMAQTKCVPMIPGTNTRDVRNGARLTNSQSSKLRDHCTVKDGCA